jgi:hypothetical protein
VLAFGLYDGQMWGTLYFEHWAWCLRHTLHASDVQVEHNKTIGGMM